MFDFCALLQVLIASQTLDPALFQTQSWQEQGQKVQASCQAQKKDAAEKAAKDKKEDHKK
jgi:hypothetical protein